MESCRARQTRKSLQLAHKWIVTGLTDTGLQVNETESARVHYRAGTKTKARASFGKPNCMDYLFVLKAKVAACIWEEGKEGAGKVIAVVDIPEAAPAVGILHISSGFLMPWSEKSRLTPLSSPTNQSRGQ